MATTDDQTELFSSYNLVSKVKGKQTFLGRLNKGIRCCKALVMSKTYSGALSETNTIRFYGLFKEANSSVNMNFQVQNHSFNFII